MPTIFKTCALALLTLALIPLSAARADSPCCVGMSVPMCPVPYTKSYRIEANFCPQVVVGMIAQCVPTDACGKYCGPIGIPPIYVAGRYVMVHQTPAVHAEVVRFLTDLGAYIPPRPPVTASRPQNKF